ncbi:MAG: hypothetical protein O2819_02300 [Planctomycetota bacterium]|nr:hypothetical protein [Planctomycetota bacterium]MDA1106492.1 hypothetical protein [Planctomycetota bacterium]
MSNQYQQVTAVLKSNVSFIILGLVAVSVPVAGWYFGSGQREAVAKKAELLAQDISALDRAGQVSPAISLDIPGQQAPFEYSGIASAELVRALRERVDQILAGSIGVDQTAIDRNRGEHALLKSTRPGRTVDLRDMAKDEFKGEIPVFPENFHEALVQSYLDLFRSVDAGSPPPAELVLKNVQVREAQLMAGEFEAPAGMKLEPDQEAALRSKLAAVRLAEYRDAARGLRFYGDPFAAGMPSSSFPKLEIVQMHAQLWRLWIVEDMVGAIVGANQGFDSLLTAPVKRLTALYFGPIYPEKESAPAGLADADSMAPAAMPGKDFRQYHTGRASNDIADLVRVRIDVVVETRGVPRFVDALATQNFVTIVNARLTPVDSFAAAREGFIYGSEPCSLLHLELETVWLRGWTCDLMPEVVRARLGARCGGPMDGADTNGDPSAGAGADDVGLGG